MSVICNNCGCVIRENNSLCPACGTYTPRNKENEENLDRGIFMKKYSIENLKELNSCNKLIVFVGVIGSGKGFQSDMLIEKGYTKVDFADALRQECYDMLDLPYLDPEAYDQFKKDLIPLTDKVLLFFTEFGFPKEADGTCILPEKITGRVLLQHVGEMRRKQDPNYWVKQWKIKVDKILKKGGKVVSSDARHFNEIMESVSCIYPGTVVFCNYVSSRYDATNPHISEEMAQYLLSEKLENLQIFDRDIMVKLIKRYGKN